MSELIEGQHAAEFLVSEASGRRSRETITVLSGEDLKSGHVIGKTRDTVTTAADASNTGDGTISLSAAPTTAGVQFGDYRAICIEPAADGGTFAVFAPDGRQIGTVEVGAEFSDEVAFTINDGATNFVAGDGFTVTVPDAGKWAEYDPAGVTGESTARGVLYAAVDATDGDADGVAIVREAEVVAEALQWFDGATDAQKDTGKDELADAGIIAR